MNCRPTLHKLLAYFLPATYYALNKPTQTRDWASMLGRWARAMQEAKAAAEEADQLKVPSFHWARIYRI